MFVECFECSNEDAPILKDAPHSIVDMLKHLTTLTHRLMREENHYSKVTPPNEIMSSHFVAFRQYDFSLA